MLNASDSTTRTRINFDDNWRFSLGNAADPDKDFGYGATASFSKAGSGVGALSGGFDDSDWRKVDLPHDWAVELPFVQGGTSDHCYHGFKPIGRPYPETTIGWYRKKFDIASSELGRRISLEFDGVFRDCSIWVNGHFIGQNLSGYSGFSFDVSDYLNYGGQNVVAVRVDASQYEGWFYEGAGIYRHTWLNTTHDIHLRNHGVFVSTSVKGKIGKVQVSGEILNESVRTESVAVMAECLDEHGKIVATSNSKSVKVGHDSSSNFSISFDVNSPELWSIEAPKLYKTRLIVSQGNKEIDRYECNSGFRTIVFDKNRGILLNGTPVKIKGSCCHQDHAGVGSAIPDRVNEWRIEQLKSWGFNALRTSHNPPTPEVLDACDRLGMLVFDENRLLGSSPEIVDQLTRLVERDRNHPSVMCWSLANEEGEATTDRGGRIATSMIRVIRRLDPTRPISYASNAGNNAGGANSLVDWRGFNYMKISDIDKYHAEHPDQLIWGSEEASALSTRGEYFNDKEKGYMASYDVNEPGWGATAEGWWSFFNKRPWLAGAFVWTGFDYRGEPTPYRWPCISSHFGVLDTCGFPKDTAYYYKSWWTNEPVVHILPHWNWPGKEGKEVEVWVHSNLEEVELFVNNISLGKKKMPKDGHLEWKATYQPGEVVAKGYRNGQVVLTESRKTTGSATKLKLDPDRTEIMGDKRDVSIITVSGLDSKNLIDPLGNQKVSFSISGGQILGVGNGDPSCHEPDKFFAHPNQSRIQNWVWKSGIDDYRAEWSEPNFDASSWSKIKIDGDGSAMKPNTKAVYRATFEGLAESLGVGHMDDEGWVYVNGKLVGHTTDWNMSMTADIRSVCTSGTNVVVIVVQNNANVGGLGRGVRISSPAPEVQWSRSLFHGLAQIIVASDGSGQDIVLKAESPGLTPAEIKIKTKRT